MGYQRTSFILGKLKDTGFPQSSLVPFDTAEECDELLSKGSKKGGVSAAFLEIPYLRIFLRNYCNTYKIVEVPFKVDGFGFVSFHIKTSSKVALYGDHKSLFRRFFQSGHLWWLIFQGPS